MMMRQATAVTVLVFLSVFTPTLSQLTLEYVTLNQDTANCAMYALNAVTTFIMAIGSDPPPAVKYVGVAGVGGLTTSYTGYYWAQGVVDSMYTPVSAKTMFSSITGGSISGSQPSGTSAMAVLQLFTDGQIVTDAGSPLSQPAASGLKGPQGQDLHGLGGSGTIVGANFTVDASAAAPALETYLTKYIGTYTVTNGVFSLMPTNSSATNKDCRLTLTNLVIRGTAACTKLATIIPLEGVDAVESATAASRGQLVAVMGTSTDCPAAQQYADYILVSQSPNWVIRLSGVELAVIISWGSCELAVVVPYKAVSASLTTLGLTPQLDDKTRPLLLVISIERMTYIGTMANDSPMIIDVIVTATLDYVLLFKAAYKNGKTLQSEGGNMQQILVLKFRLFLPHTSTVAGYGDGGSSSSSGSNSGLYGLLALIAVPVLLCLCLLGWLAYEYYRPSSAFENPIEVANGKQYIPEAYVPASTVASSAFAPSSAYLPPSYVPCPTPM